MVIIAAVIIAVIAAALIKKPENTQDYDREVSIEIRCDQLSENMDKLNDQALVSYIPQDGTILPKTICGIESGKSTVFDVLEKICRQEDIQMEYSSTPGYGGAYIEGINYLYEFSAGKYSGWMFTVDGKSPGYGADKVTLDGGEEIVWYYVVDYNSE